MNLTRRDFLITNGAGLVLLGGKNVVSVPSKGNGDHVSGRLLHLKPRYYRWHVNPGQEWTETNTGHATLDWKIPLKQCALVLVDVWQRHYIREPEERAEKIIDENLLPLMKVCRSHGLEIIHAPAPEAARIHPNYAGLPQEKKQETTTEQWPPPAFRHLSGEYRQYRRPVEPREAGRQNLPPLRIHPKVTPAAAEIVLATGDELHEYCKKKGILFLLFAGFNTNACILSRDYGTIEMSKRGYQVILVRDCTTGMESSESQATLAQTNGAILQLEMFGQYTLTSAEVMEGLE